MADNVIGVRTNAVLSREMKDWPKKRIAVEGQRLSHLLMLKLILLMTVSFGFVLLFFFILFCLVLFWLYASYIAMKSLAM